MHYFEIAPNQIVRIGQNYLTYHYEGILSCGQIVAIQVGKKNLVGVVVKEVPEPVYPTKPISSIIEQSPLPKSLLNLASWISKYYAAPLAQVIQTILPSGIQKKRRTATPSKIKISNRKRVHFLFNQEQQSVLETLNKFTEGTFLLHGITGSGKTAIYMNLAQKALDSGKSVIVLVPEIALTSQIISEFSNNFDQLVLTHSNMSESDRHNTWRKILNNQDPQIIIGPRSALFTPVTNLGLIIVDEAHDASFKQDHTPRYSAVRAATVLGQLTHSIVILGSATPDIVDYFLATKSSRPILQLTKVARTHAVPPKISMVDLTNRSLFKKHRFLSDQLLSKIEQTLCAHNQTLIFQNRRGGASTTMCENCGWTMECPKCFLPMTLDIVNHSTKCHICGLEQKIPTCCPQCGSVNIIHKGIGTQLIEQEMKKLFPLAKISRFDADSKKSESLANKYNQVYAGDVDIIIGTQIVAKGLDLPKLRTVGVIQADSGLSLPDFNADERTFQLLDQVTGRVGRNQYPSDIIIQTYQPNHPSIKLGANSNYQEFYNHTIATRKKTCFPPFTYLLKLTCSFKTEKTTVNNSKKVAQNIKANFPTVQVMGPTPCLHERHGNEFRWQIVIKSSKRETLLEIISSLPTKSWQYDIDPTSLI